MRTINLKTVVLCCIVALLTPVYLNAQYQIYTGPQLDHTYLTVKDILPSDASTYGAGYVISSTVFNTPKQTPPRGEIMRTNPGGAPIWTGQYGVNGGGTDHRFNHIEKYTFNGQVEYLVVGSISYAPNNNTLLVALLDDNGSVILSQEYMSANFTNLIGLKGIAVSDNTFAIVAQESDGFDKTNVRNIVVMKLDASLGMITSMSLSSNGNMYDHDTPTDIVEGMDADHFFIVGTANKNTDFFTPNSLPCAFAAMVDLFNNNLMWSYNYSTAYGNHWDAAADGYFDGNDRFWVLANSSVIHYYNLTELDANSGGVIRQIQFSDSTYSSDFNHYGYELKPSLFNSENFVISGWKGEYGTTQNIQPFLVEIEKDSAHYVWQWKYNGDKNLQLLLNENDWLGVKAAGQFPYFYNDMMTTRPNGMGYAMLTTDSTRRNVEDVMFWFATDSNGIVSAEECGYYNPLGDSIDQFFIENTPLDKVNNMINPGIDDFLDRQDIVYNRDLCHGNYDGEDDDDDAGGGDGGDGSEGKATGKQNGYAIYPNPMEQGSATAIISLEAESPATVQVAIYDMLGKQYYKGNYTLTKGNNQLPVDVSNAHMAAGMYTVQISGDAINKNILLLVK